VFSFDAGSKIADYMNVSACQGGPWRVELFLKLLPAHTPNCMDFPERKYDPCHLRCGKSANTKMLKEQSYKVSTCAQTERNCATEKNITRRSSNPYCDNSTRPLKRNQEDGYHRIQFPAEPRMLLVSQGDIKAARLPRTQEFSNQ
jgi:hypothetical protein